MTKGKTFEVGQVVRSRIQGAALSLGRVYVVVEATTRLWTWGTVVRYVVEDGYGTRAWLSEIEMDAEAVDCQECDQALAWDDVLAFHATPNADLDGAPARCRACQVKSDHEHGVRHAPAVLALLLLAASLFGNACATAPRAVEVEAVGQLAASATHVTQAPVHETTDLTPGGFVAAGDDGDDRGMTVASPEVETPDVAPKGGLVMGGAR